MLSPSSQGTQSGGVTPGQTSITVHTEDPPPPPPAPVTLSEDCLTVMARIMSKSVASAVREEFERRDDYDDDDDFDPNELDNDDEYDDVGTAEPNDNGDDALIDLNNNDVPKLPIPDLSSIGIGVHANAGPSRPVDPVPPVVEVDAVLPPARRKRPPTTWHPKEVVLNWLDDNCDGLEMSDQDREKLVAEFSPDEKWDHLFTAVKPPVDFMKAYEDPASKKLDFLFDRLACEQDFQRAHDDMACGVRILTEIMSGLTFEGHALDKVGMDKYKAMCGRLYQFLASSSYHSLLGRRELGRKFVPKVNAPALYSTRPTHLGFFGGTTTAAAVNQAVEDAKVNKALVVLPQKRPFRGRSTHPGGKTYYNNRDSRPYRSQYSRYGNRQGNFQQGGRGRGRGTRRKRQRRANPKPSTQE